MAILIPCRTLVFWLATSWLLWPSFSLFAAEPPAREYSLKAAFIYHLSQFIDWPAGDENRAFRICVLGADPFGDSLKALEKRSHKNQAIEIYFPQSMLQARECHIIYLAQELRGSTASILAQLRDYGVLTVSSLPGFIDQGGMVGFVLEDGKVRLEINAGATRRAKFKLSAKLLEVARRVLDADMREGKP